ncbi:Peroxyureidoacrylate/ureidoacrylate amidohydrolase RutB [Vibrio stylophorae]|uniref:Peroxyureidoacrylate/ureidoacrylate amidohydrolase RutB n=1 Tax=Vibrio stylophorae TaxID=659351 RepID=A0ABN8DW82_9VIBR|nr:Peroxyureidoacrylate/ureidoacrylate amidohydrolase RutB [Vibrio stylophorae]
MLNNINAVTKLARAKSVPVIFIQHEQPKSVIEYESAGWALQSSLVTQTGDYFVRKTTPDSFLNTNLQRVLSELNVDSLIVCGYASEFCIDTTIRRAAGLGYCVTLVSDAHTTHDKEHAIGAQIRAHHNVTLPNITSFGVKIEVVEARNLWV